MSSNSGERGLRGVTHNVCGLVFNCYEYSLKNDILDVAATRPEPPSCCETAPRTGCSLYQGFSLLSAAEQVMFLGPDTVSPPGGYRGIFFCIQSLWIGIQLLRALLERGIP
jgi:hypothetical protein